MIHLKKQISIVLSGFDKFIKKKIKSWQIAVKQMFNNNNKNNFNH